MYLHVLRAMKTSMGGMFSKSALTISLVMCCSLIRSQVYPRIRRIAEWWKERSLLRLASDRFQVSDPHRSVLRGPATYAQYFTRWSTLLLLKMCLRMPSCAEALLMRDLISASQVRSGVSMVPRYLKVLVKGMELVPPLSVRGGGHVFSVV